VIIEWSVLIRAGSPDHGELESSVPFRPVQCVRLGHRHVWLRKIQWQGAPGQGRSNDKEEDPLATDSSPLSCLIEPEAVDLGCLTYL